MAHLRETAWVFLKLGTTAFGGPVAHVAMMEDEVVRRRGWVSQRDFLDLYSATNFIPGPNSTEMAIHLGYRRAGWAGLVVAGLCFIVPAVVIVLACAWAYVGFGQAPGVRGMFEFVAPVILAIIAQAVWRLSRTALIPKPPPIWCISVGAGVAAWFGVGELAVLGIAGVLAGAMGGVGARRRGPASVVPWCTGALGASGAGVLAGLPTPGAVFWVFAKIGSVLFGSGYVLVAFLQTELVERRGWLTQAQLLDAIAVGQCTPGPLFTSATFVGYLLGGLPGAGAATGGIFAPAFVFVALTAPLVARLRRWPVLGAALDGVNGASLALMVVVLVRLARGSLHAWPAWVGVLAALVLLVRWRVNSALLVCAAAIAGVAWTLLR